MNSSSSIFNELAGAASLAARVLSITHPELRPIIPLGLEIVQKVIKVAESIMTDMNLLNPDEHLSDMGDRLLQTQEAGIISTDYDNFEDYINAIRSFELDPEKSKTTTELEKDIAGLQFATLSLQSKFEGSDAANLSNLWVLAAQAPDFFTGERISSLLSITTDMKSIKDYFDGKLTSSSIDIIEQKLVDAEKILSPDKTDNAIYEILDSAKEKYRAQF